MSAESQEQINQRLTQGVESNAKSIAVLAEGSATRYKGVKASVADLPASGNYAGDLYAVSINNQVHGYFWNGTQWQDGGLITRGADETEFVKLTGDQTISGSKTFQQTVKSKHGYSFEAVTDTDWSVVPENPIYNTPLRLVYKKNGQNEYVHGPYLSFSRNTTGVSIGINTTDYNGNYSASLSIIREDDGTNRLRYNGDLVKGSAFATVGMPNMTNRVDLTLPSEQGGNVVPSSNYNGWVQLTASTPSTNTSESVISFTYTGTNIGVQSSSILPSSPVRIMLPVIKGQSISVKWTNCTVSSFQFIKANAEVQ